MDDEIDDDIDELFELMLLVGHRARVALKQLCAAYDGRVGCEVLLLKTLARAGQRMKRHELAHALGWSPVRVTQVVDRLIVKGLVRRMRGYWLTEDGLDEAVVAGELVRALEEAVFEGLDQRERRVLLDSLRRVADNTERHA